LDPVLAVADRALALELGGDARRALRVVLPLLESYPGSAHALHVTGRALVAMGLAEPARKAFELAAARALDAGNLPLSILACREIERAGGTAAERLDELGEIFAKGSPRLAERPLPPSLGGPTAEPAPLGPAVGDAAVLARLESALAEAERFPRPSPARVAPHVLFSSLTAPGLRSLMRTFEVVAVAVGSVLIEEGTQGSHAYVIARGELEVRKATSRDESFSLARLGSGAVFGEMALLSRAPRAASVVASRPTLVLGTSRAALNDIAAREPEVGEVFAEFCRKRMMENLFRTSSILGAVEPADRTALLQRFVMRSFEPGDRVIVQGAESEGLYLVASGQLEVVHRDASEDKTIIVQLGPGEVVGEVALVLRRPANADVVARHPTLTLHLPRDRFLEAVKAHPEVLAELYELAVKRDEETRTIVAQEATEVDDSVLL
jgi:cAMP-dependent protein kinase regulator